MKTVHDKLQADRLRLFYSISHDIKTPLSAVTGYASLLEQMAQEPEKVREYALKIRSSGDMILSLINDVLDFARLEYEQTLASETFDLAWLVEEAAESIMPQVHQKGHDFRMFMDAGGNCTKICGDKTKLGRILSNLLSNAVKYTDDGGHITFETKLDRETLTFCITDDGHGMDKKFLDKIFEPFSRAEGTMQPGTGLGMMIVKELTELMGGTIKIKSRPSEGTAVSVKIRYKR